MATEMTTTIITIALFIGAIAWGFVVITWFLGRLGLWKFATYRRLKRRFKNQEFDDKIIEWCLDKFERKWRYKDIRRFSKYEKNQGEIIYTYLMLSKLPKKELKGMIERRLRNGRQESRGIKEEARKSLPSFPRG